MEHGYLDIITDQNFVSFLHQKFRQTAKKKIGFDNILFHLEKYRLKHVAMLCVS